MKANELRIGNWINPENPYQIDANLFQNVFNGLFDEDPIPLTEEWLLKFGFEYWKQELDIKCFYKSFGIEFIRIALNGYWSLSSGIKDDSPMWRMGNNYPFITYVHQLQNLYFALTCEELKIKKLV